MTDDRAAMPRSGVIQRAASATLRPLTGAVTRTAEAGISLERWAIDRLLEGGEFERLLDSDRLRAVVKQVIESDGAKQLIDTFFDSGLFDRFIDRLLASSSLWHLVDEVAASPSVTAAISQQGLGLADQVGDQVRGRARQADDWLERAAHRVIHRRQTTAVEPDASGR